MKNAYAMLFVAAVAIVIIVGLAALAPDVPYYPVIVIGVTVTAVLTMALIVLLEKR